MGEGSSVLNFIFVWGVSFSALLTVGAEQPPWLHPLSARSTPSLTVRHVTRHCQVSGGGSTAQRETPGLSGMQQRVVGSPDLGEPLLCRSLAT